MSGGRRCPRCAGGRERLAGLYVGARFIEKSVLQRSIHALKYKGQCGLAGPLTTILPAHGLPAEAVLVPVPLFRERQRERGYNQAALLAERYGKALGLPVQPLLERVRSTEPQATLGREARRENVRDAFRCVGPAPPVAILVDDVATTLSTLHACAEALHDGGSGWVGGLVLARA